MININFDQIKQIAKNHNLELVYLFGSKIGGTKNEESDLDLAVKFPENYSADAYLNLYKDLSDIFPSENIDLVILNEADPFFANEVIQKGKLLFEKENMNQEFSRMTFRKFNDDGQKYFPYLKQKLYAGL